MPPLSEVHRNNLTEYLYRSAEFIIANFKTRYINDQGHIVRVYPQMEGNIYADFDDLVPFFMYFKEDGFVLDHFKISKDTTHNGLIVFNGKIVSWRNDEYLGALCSFYREHPEPWLKKDINDIYENIKKYLVRGNNIIAYYDLNRNKASKIYSPWAGGLLEVFLENSDLFPSWKETALSIIDHWLQGESFRTHGLFMAKNHMRNDVFNRWNAKYKIKSRFLNHSLWNTTGYYLNRKSSNKQAILESLFNALFSLPTGFHFQFMKLNTNFIFSIIEAYKITKDKKYQKALDRWIISVKEKLCKDGFLSGGWNPVYAECQPPRMADHFTMIDILCDYYVFVDKKEEYLTWARELADQWLTTRLPCGLYPLLKGDSIANIDNQVDFAISLRRIGELGGIEDYTNKGLEMLQTAMHLYRKDTGFVTLVDKDGNQKRDYIEVKYNALFLKGIISLLEKDKVMYSHSWLHNLLKDR